MEDTSTIKVCENCRRIRLCVVFLFMVSSVLAGVFWAHVGQSNDGKSMLLAIAFTAVSAVLILGVEIVVTKVELEAKRLYIQLKDKVEEIRILKEKIGDLDRSLDLLARDDEDVRRQLLDERMHRPAVESFSLPGESPSLPAESPSP